MGGGGNNPDFWGDVLAHLVARYGLPVLIVLGMVGVLFWRCLP